MKKLLALSLALLLVLTLFSCKHPAPPAAEGTPLTDVYGNTARLTRESRVVSLHASFSDCWLLAGGTLVGVTEDAVSEHGLAVGSAAIIGTAKTVDEEALLALSPDYVLLSADLAAHQALDARLTSLGIAHGYFRIDTFADYEALMSDFTAIQERPDLFAMHVTAKKARITEILQKIPAASDRTVLLARVYSGGIKAKRTDNPAGQILAEYHLDNIADEFPSLLEDVSLEYIVRADPDYIFILTMGSEEAARAYLAANLESSPAWQGLSAVKSGNCYLLPKTLFHHKPNERWDESYEYLARIVYPEQFPS